MRVAGGNLAPSGLNMGANFNSAPLWLAHIANFSIQVNYSGSSLEGTLKLQVSNDEPRTQLSQDFDTSGIVNWTDLTGASVDIDDDSGSIMFNQQDSGYSWVRVVWTRTAGTGTANSINWFIKGV